MPISVEITYGLERILMLLQVRSSQYYHSAYACKEQLFFANGGNFMRDLIFSGSLSHF